MVKSHLGTILTETERCWMFATAWLQFCTLPTNLFPTHYIESQELCWSKWNEAFSFRHNHLWCMYLVSIPRVQKVERSTLTKKLHFCDLRYQGRRRNEMKWWPETASGGRNSKLKSRRFTNRCEDQCDQIWRFIGLWPTFICFWQHLICPNLSHS